MTWTGKGRRDFLEVPLLPAAEVGGVGRGEAGLRLEVARFELLLLRDDVEDPRRDRAARREGQDRRARVARDAGGEVRDQRDAARHLREGPSGPIHRGGLGALGDVRRLEIVDELPALVVLEAFLGDPAPEAERLDVRAGLADGVLFDPPDRGEHLDLLAGAEEGQGLGVALLQGGEERASEGGDLAGELLGDAQVRHEAVVRQRRVEGGDRGADVDPLRGGLGEEGRVDRRLEERERAADALEVQAVAELEEAVADDVPVAEELGVRRDAEVEVVLRQIGCRLGRELQREEGDRRRRCR